MDHSPPVLPVLELNGWVSRAYRLPGSLIVLCDNKPVFLPSGNPVQFGNRVPPVFGLHRLGSKVLALCADGLYRIENLSDPYVVTGARNWRHFHVHFAKRVSSDEGSPFLVAGHMHDRDRDEWVTQLALHDDRGDFIHCIGSRLRGFKLRGLQVVGRPNSVGAEIPLVVVFGNDSAFAIELNQIEEGTQAPWDHFANHSDLHDVCQCWTKGPSGYRKYDLWGATEHGLKCWDWGARKWSTVEKGAFYSLHSMESETGQEQLYAAAEEGLCCVPSREWIAEWTDGHRPSAFIDLREGTFLARVNRKSRKSTLVPLFHAEH